jgi:hypothetical protein
MEQHMLNMNNNSTVGTQLCRIVVMILVENIIIVIVGENERWISMGAKTGKDKYLIQRPVVEVNLYCSTIV